MTDAPAAVSQLRRRVIDDMTLGNLSPATQRILPACRDKVQLVLRPLAGSSGLGMRALCWIPGVAGRLLPGAQPDGLRCGSFTA
ncbi:hypothetical protein BLJAPNOD_05232 [Ensifer sp. M14]|nr:hypothetical protein BLJAPNOD_05232 [Ensifer sp. M14]